MKHAHQWEPWTHAITGQFFVSYCPCGAMRDTERVPEQIYKLTLYASTGERKYELLPKDHPAYNHTHAPKEGTS